MDLVRAYRLFSPERRRLYWENSIELSTQLILGGTQHECELGPCISSISDTKLTDANTLLMASWVVLCQSAYL
jgi:hypothetical protein